MAVHKSAVKAARSSETHKKRNKAVRSAIKTYVARAEKDIAGAKGDAAKQSAEQAISELDRAAQKKVIHPKNAARRKSRLMKKLNQAAKTKPS